MRKRILAVVLSLVMLLSALPIAAFAENFATQTGSSAIGSAPSSQTRPTPMGTGADGTITLEIDAAAILAALKADRSLDTVIDLIKDAITRSEADIIVLADLVEMIPMNAIVNSLLGANNEKAPALIKQFGGLEQMMKLVDEKALLLTANKAELIDFVLELEDAVSLFYAENVINLDVHWNLTVAYQYANHAVVEERMKNLTYEQILSLVGGDPANLDKVVFRHDLLEDMLVHHMIPLQDAIHFGELQEHEDVEAALIQLIKSDYAALLSPAGLARIQSDILATVNGNSFDAASFKDGKLEDLAADLAGSNLANYIGASGELQASRFLSDYNSQVTAILRVEAEAYVKNNTSTVYLKESAIDGVINRFVSGLTVDYFHATDFDEVELELALLKIAEDNNIDLLHYLEDDYVPFNEPGVSAIVMQHINWTAVDDPTIVNREALMNLLVGNGSVSDLMTEEGLKGFLNDDRTDLTPVFEMIEAGVVALESIVNLDKLIKAIPESKYAELMGLIDRTVLVNQLKPHALTLAKKLNKDQIKDILLPVASTLIQNIDLISLNGYKVAAEMTTGDTAGLLSFNTEEALKAIVSMIPTVSDLKNCTDGKILSINLYAEYKNVAQEDRVKDINFELVIKGDFTPILKLIEKIEQYISITKDGEMIKAEINLPAAVTETYKSFLLSKEGTQVLNDVLGLAGKTGEEITAELANLTLDQILELLSRIDISALYNRIMNISYVELVLEKINALTGNKFTLASIQDLDTVLDQISNGAPSFEAISNALAKKVKVDVIAILKKATAFADRNATIQSYLNKLSGVPYIGTLLDNNSLTEIIDNYKGIDPLEAVASFVAKKAGINFLRILKDYDANELYQLALDKVAGYESYFNRVRDFALNMLDPDFVPTTTAQKLVKKFIPESMLRELLAGSILGLYNGEGSFTAATPVISLDIGAYAKKAVNALLGRVELNEVLEGMIANMIPDMKIAFGLSLTLNFQNLSKVTYQDAQGNTLYEIFLADGMNPAPYLDGPVVDGKTFLYWADVNGNEITAIEGDTILRPVYETWVYTVTFRDESGAYLWSYEVEWNQNVTEIPTVPTAEALGLHNGIFNLVWTVATADGTVITPAEILASPVTADVIYYFHYELVEGSEFFVPAEGTTVEVEKDANGNYTVTIEGAQNGLDLTIKADAIRGTTSLVINGDGVTVKMDAALIEQLTDAAGVGGIIRPYISGGKTVAFQTEHYHYSSDDGYHFNLDINNVAFTENFASAMSVTVDFAEALEANEQQKTVVYVIENGVNVPVNCVVTPGVGVEILAPHFSEYVILNEYLVTAKFTDGTRDVAGVLANIAGLMVPAEAKILTVRPALTETYGKYIDEIYFMDENGQKVNVAKIGDSMIMPACPAEIVMLVKNITFTTYYSVGNQLFTSKTEADAYASAHTELVPKGYVLAAGEWIGSTSSTQDVYLTPKYTPITYTLTFEGVATPVTFTVENYHLVKAPAVVEREGYTGAWNLPAQLDAVLALMDSENKATVGATYTAKEYKVYYPTTTDTVAFGQTVTVSITAENGYTIEKLYLLNKTTGARTEITNNSFVMPASDVEILVQAKANVLSFQLKNLSVTNGTSDFTASFGSYASYEITVAKGYYLAQAPSLGKLITYTVNEDGSKTLTYAFAVDAAVANNTVITYKVEKKVAQTLSIANGLLTTEGEPASAVEGLLFNGFATPEDARFETAAYRFATYVKLVEPANLLWLWILLAVVILIALIAILYTVYIRTNVRPNFIFRFATWAVTIFFNICLGISAIVLWITQGTTKKEKIDFNEFGLANPEPETDEEFEIEPETVEEEIAEEVAAEESAEAIEETVEETSEETEEVETAGESNEDPALNDSADTENAIDIEVEETEEAVEENAEEAVEETVEEAVEETVEEAVEETVEEAVEETAEEAVEETAEEAVEETVEEAVEETAEETVEETAEEAVEETVEEAAPETAEETVEEVAEEATEETEKKDNE